MPARDIRVTIWNNCYANRYYRIDSYLPEEEREEFQTRTEHDLY